MLKNIFVPFILLLVLLGCSPKVAPKSTAETTTPPTSAPPPPAPLPNSSSQEMSAIPMDPKVKIGKLPNGMTYYIRQNLKPDNRAELRLAVSAG
jgi:zinc protease